MKKVTTLRELAVAAMRDASERLKEEHRRAGLPLILWKDGKVVREYVKDAPSARERTTRYRRG